MLGINTVLICHKPQEIHGKQGSMRGREQVRQNSTVLGVPALLPDLLQNPGLLESQFEVI